MLIFYRSRPPLNTVSGDIFSLALLEIPIPLVFVIFMCKTVSIPVSQLFYIPLFSIGTPSLSLPPQPSAATDKKLVFLRLLSSLTCCLESGLFSLLLIGLEGGFGFDALLGLSGSLLCALLHVPLSFFFFSSSTNSRRSTRRLIAQREFRFNQVDFRFFYISSTFYFVLSLSQEYARHAEGRVRNEVFEFPFPCPGSD